MSRRLLNKVNEVSAITLVVWFTLPYFRSLFGANIALLSIALWLITCEKLWIIERWSKDMFFVMCFFATFLPHFAFGVLSYGEAGVSVISKGFPLFFIGLFINHYYMFNKKSDKVLGRIALFSIICYSIGSLQTFFVLQQFPRASRILATTYTDLKEVYFDLGVGGFGYVYAGLFLAISVLFLIRKDSISHHRGIKLAILFTFLAISSMIIKASYTISIILFFIGLLFLIIPFKRRSGIFVLLIIFMFLILFLTNTIGLLVLHFSEIFSRNEIASSKLQDLALWLLQQGGSEETGYRLFLYEISFTTFLANPIFGIYGPTASPGHVGGHSGWFDLLAFYGLFSAVPFILAIYFNFRKMLRFFKGSLFAKHLLISQLLFIVLAFINPVLYIYEIGFMLFTVLPSLPFLPYAFGTSDSKKSERKD